MTALSRKSLARSLFLGIGVFALAACETTQAPAPQRPSGPIVERPTTPRPVTPTPTDSDRSDEREPEETEIVERPDAQPGEAPARPGTAPAHLQGQSLNRLALLLPFSAENPRLRAEATSMMQAAELAVFERDMPDTVLIVLDTQGTASGAKQATEAAIARGADVILGPILAREVEAASKAARKEDVPVVAFSTDASVAGRGTYLLSFPPQAEVERIVDYVARDGTQNFAILRPDNAYGRLVGESYRMAVARAGAQITASEAYSGSDISAMQEPAKRLADFHRAGETASRGTGRQAFEAVLLPEGGTALRSLAPLLPFYNSSMNNVQFLGTALWMREDTAREPALRGGLFAGPDQAPREEFEASFERAFGTEPSRLASLAHDAVEVGAVIAEGDPRLRRTRAEDLAGFYGADGFVRFNADGTPARGLAVYEIRNGSFRIVDPAPTGPIGTN